MSKRLITRLRWLFTLFVVALLFYLQERPITSSDEPIQLYASVCHDDLRKTFLNAIQEATNSIHLVMYSLSDEKVIQALNQKAAEGIEITVIHDTSTSQSGYEKLTQIRRSPLKMNGLMHQKILIVDHKKVWIGSANFSTESLRLHDNLVTAFTSSELSQTILQERLHRTFTIGGQLFEFWSLPRDKKEGLMRLIKLINGAEKSIRVAMYTWTHPRLTNAIVEAHKRGVSVEIILDRGQANGVGRKAFKRLIKSGVSVWLSCGKKLLHHKCLWVDGTILVNGSANWTRAAFSRNRDCFFILHDLTEDQQKKLKTMWSRTRILSNKQHFAILWQRPKLIGNDQFELISWAA